MTKKDYEAGGRLMIDKELLDMIKLYERQYRANKYDETLVTANKLGQCNVETTFAVDLIYFTDCHTNEVLYSFEL